MLLYSYAIVHFFSVKVFQIWLFGRFGFFSWNWFLEFF